MIGLLILTAILAVLYVGGAVALGVYFKHTTRHDDATDPDAGIVP